MEKKQQLCTSAEGKKRKCNQQNTTVNRVSKRIKTISAQNDNNGATKSTDNDSELLILADSNSSTDSHGTKQHDNSSLTNAEPQNSDLGGRQNIIKTDFQDNELAIKDSQPNSSNNTFIGSKIQVNLPKSQIQNENLNDGKLLASSKNLTNSDSLLNIEPQISGFGDNDGQPNIIKTDFQENELTINDSHPSTPNNTFISSANQPHSKKPQGQNDSLTNSDAQHPVSAKTLANSQLNESNNIFSSCGQLILLNTELQNSSNDQEIFIKTEFDISSTTNPSISSGVQPFLLNNEPQNSIDDQENVIKIEFEDSSLTFSENQVNTPKNAYVISGCQNENLISSDSQLPSSPKNLKNSDNQPNLINTEHHNISSGERLKLSTIASSSGQPSSDNIFNNTGQLNLINTESPNSNLSSSDDQAIRIKTEFENSDCNTGISQSTTSNLTNSGSQLSSNLSNSDQLVAKQNLIKTEFQDSILIINDNQPTVENNILFNKNCISTKGSQSNLKKTKLKPTNVSNISGVQSNTTKTTITLQVTEAEMNLDDIALWPKLNCRIIDILVKQGPKQITNHNFPCSDSRKFNVSNYERKLANGTRVPRSWMIYSVSKDAAFCFCCKLFASTEHSNHIFISTGFRNWNNCFRAFKRHEKSELHLQTFILWKSFEKNCNHTEIMEIKIDIRQNIYRWQEILKRTIICVQHFVTNSRENEPNSLFQLLDTISKTDLVLTDHLRQLPTSQYPELNKNIGNDIIHIISKTIENKIVDDIKKVKYYSIIVDCTLDETHTEQYSLIVRFVQFSKKSYVLKEYFLGFLPIKKSAVNINLKKMVLEKLEQCGLSVEDCRGFSCEDNKHYGIQLHPNTLYVPCVSYSLHSIITDSVKCSQDAVYFFRIIRELFSFFSKSTTRWDTLKKYIVTQYLTTILTTQWEITINILKPLKKGLGDIYEAIIEIALTADPETKLTATSLGNQIFDFKFICMLLIWYDILEIINIPSLYMQSKNMCIRTAISQLISAKSSLTDLRTETKFDEYIHNAELYAITLEIPCQFPILCPLRSRKFCQSDKNLDPKIKFKVDFYYMILDQTIECVQRKIIQMDEHSITFGFLYSIESLSFNTYKKNLPALCKFLAKILRTDFEYNEIITELESLSLLIKSSTVPLNLLKYIYDSHLEELLPNVVIVLRILLTLPITNTFDNFFDLKLNLIKNYVSSNRITEEKLEGLSFLSIEKELVLSLNYDDIIHNLAEKKALKMKFGY